MIAGAQLVAVLGLLGAAYPIYCLSAQFTKPGARYLLGLCGVCALLPAVTVLLAGADSVHVQHAVLTMVGPLYFLGVSEYLGFFDRWRKHIELALFVYVSALVLWALPLGWQIPYISFPSAISFEEELGAWVMKITSYALLLVASIKALRHFRAAQAKFIYSLCFALLPLAMGVADLAVTLMGRSPTSGVNPSHVVIVVALFAWTYGLARTRLILRPPVTQQGVMKHMRDAYCVIGSDGEIIDCNRRFALICGSTSRLLIGAEAGVVLPLEIANELGRQAFDSQQILLANEKGKRNYEASLAPLSQSVASPAVLLTLRDSTQELEVRASLEKKEQELAEAYRRLDEMSFVDSLTGLANLGGLAAAFDKLGSRNEAKKHEAPGGLVDGIILVDIDSFGEINESHGYAIGDAVLVELARAMESTCRRSDVIARVAGEEFVVLATATDRDRLQGAAQRLRKHIRHTRIRLANNVTLQVTASIGATEVRAGQSLEQAIAQANALLQRAKSGGRDRVEFAPAENLVVLPKKPDSDV